MTDHVTITTQNRVTTVTMARPDKRNAISQAMYAKMAQALRDYGESDDARALVITGEGEYFTAGNDLKDFATGSDSDGPAPVVQFLEAISSCPKPVIGAVNGPAIGVGLTMLLHCDLAFASDTATMSAPFVGLGLVPEAASSLLLPQAVGVAVANDIFMTGRALTASEALNFGLISRVFAPEQFADQVHAIAAQVANSAPTALKQTKALVLHQRDLIASQMATEGKIFRDQLASPDFAESVAAKMQGRAPVF